MILFRDFHTIQQTTVVQWLISERSEPLSRVFNDQLRNIYMVMSVRTYVSNTHAHVRMSVLR